MAKTKLIIFMLVLGLLLGGCTQATEQQGKGNSGEVSYELIDLQAAMDLKEEIRTWIEENSQEAGVYSYSVGSDRYVLISAGEKPSAGYAIEDLKLTGDEQKITIEAKLKEPGTDDLVATVITYPAVLIKIVDDGRDLDLKWL